MIQSINDKIEMVKKKRIMYLSSCIDFKKDRDLITFDTKRGYYQFPTWVDDFILDLIKNKKKKKKVYNKLLRGIRLYINPIKFTVNTKNISEIGYDKWAAVEQFFTHFKENKEKLIEIKITSSLNKRKIELCRLTKCFDEKEATLLCNICGWVMPAEARFCSECGEEMIL